VGWALALLLGLWGWELLQAVESPTPQALTLTLLFKPGVGAMEINPFLETLPPTYTRTLLEPSRLWAEAQRLLEALGPLPEGMGGSEGGAEVGWGVQLYWSRLPPEEAKALRGQVEAAALIEEAYWAFPPYPPVLPWLNHALGALFSLLMLGALGVLSLNCLAQEARHLRVLYGLGAGLGQLRGFWFGKNLLWALVAGGCAYMFWPLAARLGGLPYTGVDVYGWFIFGLSCGGLGVGLAWQRRGRLCWA